MAFEESCAPWTLLVRDKRLCRPTVIYLHMKPGLLTIWRECPNWPVHFFQTWSLFSAMYGVLS